MKRVLSIVFLVASLAACQPAADEPAAPAAAGSGAAPAEADPAAAEAPAAGTAEAPAAGSGVAAQPHTGPDAICEFVEADVPEGAVACPRGCVMVKAAPVDELLGCARTGATFEVAISCLRLPAEINPGGSCYQNEDGYAVVTSLTYPALLHAGWTTCPEDYEFRQVEACPMGEGSSNAPIVPVDDAEGGVEEAPE